MVEERGGVRGGGVGGREVMLRADGTVWVVVYYLQIIGFKHGARDDGAISVLGLLGPIEKANETVIRVRVILFYVRGN